MKLYDWQETILYTKWNDFIWTSLCLQDIALFFPTIVHNWMWVSLCSTCIMHWSQNLFFSEMYLSPGSAWNGRPWPGRSQNWMLIYCIINLSGSQQFSGSSIQNQVELSEWATGRFMHWPGIIWYAPSQWETTLCNIISHWLGAYTDQSLCNFQTVTYCCWCLLLLRGRKKFWQLYIFYYFAGTDITNAEEVAIKLECVKTKHPQLHIESKIYKMMQGGGMSGDFRFWVQELTTI